MQNLKVENYVLFGTLSAGLRLESNLSDSCEEVLRRVREEPGYMGAFVTKTMWLEHQKFGGGRGDRDGEHM